MSYQIVRYFRDRRDADGNEINRPKVMRRGLTLEEAKLHCTLPGTKAEDGSWFDGFREVKRGRKKRNYLVLDCGREEESRYEQETDKG